MGGNVLQMLDEPYLPSMNTAEQIKKSPVFQLVNAADGARLMTARGASWFVFEENYLRSSFRDPVHPGYRGDKFGFRCVLDVSGS